MLQSLEAPLEVAPLSSQLGFCSNSHRRNKAGKQGLFASILAGVFGLFSGWKPQTQELAAGGKPQTQELAADKSVQDFSSLDAATRERVELRLSARPSRLGHRAGERTSKPSVRPFELKAALSCLSQGPSCGCALTGA